MKAFFLATLVLLPSAGAGDSIPNPPSDDPYSIDSSRNAVRFDSTSYERFSGEPYYMHRNLDTAGYDTLELPERKAGADSGIFKAGEFRKYWAKVEKEDGFDKLRAQMQSRDIDRSWVPRIYLFDSNLVIFPGWFVLRKKNRKH
jgi:hypothetical protein